MHHVSAAAFMGLCEIVVQDGLHGEDMRRTGHRENARRLIDNDNEFVFVNQSQVRTFQFALRFTLTDFYLHTWPKRMVKLLDNGSVYFDAASA